MHKSAFNVLETLVTIQQQL